jgi:hypothetical protein
MVIRGNYGANGAPAHEGAAEQQLLKLYYGLQGEKPVNYEIIPLDGLETLIRIHSEAGTDQLILATFPLAERHGYQVMGVRGYLLKAKGELIRFNNVLALPKRVVNGSESSVSTNGLACAEDHLVEIRGWIISPDNKVTEFHDRSPLYEQLGLEECLTCQKGQSFINRIRRWLHLSSLSATEGNSTLEASAGAFGIRKVGRNRCWFCTSIALAVGFLISGAAAWLAPVAFGALGVASEIALRNLRWTVLGTGIGYTLWRAAFWGYLPYQNWVAHWLASRGK